MSLNGLMRIGVNGLLAQGLSLSMISGNVANVKTPTYRAQKPLFHEMLVPSASASTLTHSGLSVQERRDVERSGDIYASESPTHLGIQGQGMFVARHSPQTEQKESKNFHYTRLGDWTKDQQGYLKNSSGDYLQAWPLDKNGNMIKEANFENLKTVRAYPPKDVFATSVVKFAHYLDTSFVQKDHKSFVFEFPPTFTGQNDRIVDFFPNALGQNFTIQDDRMTRQQPQSPMIFTIDQNTTFSNMVNWLNSVDGLSTTHHKAQTGQYYLILKAQHDVFITPPPSFEKKNLFVDKNINFPVDVYDQKGQRHEVFISFSYNPHIILDQSNSPKQDDVWLFKFKGKTLKSNQKEGEYWVVPGGSMSFNEDGTLKKINPEGSAQLVSDDPEFGRIEQTFVFNNGLEGQKIIYDFGKFNQFDKTMGSYSSYDLNRPNYISDNRDVLYDSRDKRLNYIPEFLDQNGVGAGDYLFTKIGSNGMVFGVFLLGGEIPLYQIPLSNFMSENDLTQEDQLRYSISGKSGDANLFIPGGESGTQLVPKHIEGSNVDLEQELTDMIKTQRTYSASSKIISTSMDMYRVLYEVKS